MDAAPAAAVLAVIEPTDTGIEVIAFALFSKGSKSKPLPLMVQVSHRKIFLLIN
ncbi:MAG: hypothetical protein CM15mP81_10920 [Alphaproteobacteria bacterium]|nr:MAG: hypothetical protein CM15mP81_10920 [Alphaproteobacteria bacterium]